MSRFVVHESWGRISAGVNPYPPGVTFTVHDSADVYRVVGLFRSENEWNGYGRSKMVARARAAADRLAALLEVKSDRHEA